MSTWRMANGSWLIVMVNPNAAVYPPTLAMSHLAISHVRR
jgi:hypothetical protein